MKNKIIILLFLTFFPFFVSAYSKDDILTLVSTPKLCDAETENVYNQYFQTYAKIIALKDINETLANKIYAKLAAALKIVEINKICRLDELEQLNPEVKTELYDLLLEGSKLIFKAPSLQNKKTNITINSDATIDIYEDNKLVEKVSLKGPKFTYVGYEAWFVILKYFLPFSLIIVLIFIILKKKNNNFWTILISVLLILNVSYFLLGSKLYDFYSLIKTMNIKASNAVDEIEVVDRKIQKKPNYSSKYATLEIDDLAIKLPVYYGDSKQILSEGIGHTQTSSLPGEGKTIIYSGHNYDVFLAELRNIKKDMLINIETSYGRFEYQVVKIEVLKENEYSKLTSYDKETLILYTCYPFDKIIHSDSRLVVYANLIEGVWDDD